ncbi:MAG TPA: hypothetical protein DDW17_06930 [Deltaproteobacteria bacterium]|nr:hypothetical protein [Deltaproteobacteria bacterium]
MLKNGSGGKRMNKILLKFKDAVIKEMKIEKDIYKIGRKTENDIVIDNMAVSGFHAQLIKSNDTVYVEDLNSTNGTFVNGKKISKHVLNHGDVILIGSHTIEFMADIKKEVEPTQAYKTRSMDATIVLDTKAQEQILTATEKLEVLGGFIVIEGSTDQKEYLLKERVTTIGKDEGALIKLKGFFAPKVAALVNRRKEGYFITPSGGKELKVNGTRIDKRHDLKDGDIVEVGGLKLQFYIKEQT